MKKKSFSFPGKICNISWVLQKLIYKLVIYSYILSFTVKGCNRIDVYFDNRHLQ